MPMLCPCCLNFSLNRSLSLRGPLSTEISLSQRFPSNRIYFPSSKLILVPPYLEALIVIW
ncbi:hypothetical protein JHK84_041038 [Glycine max]|nr:hypothetical protein JHK87_040658 [Glycine soja]KAG4966451.1 hypothetical protein JHK85_041426 [Glycine max]KAG5122698.1 hypothetical protein JHK84_041038 [Glycine max]